MKNYPLLPIFIVFLSFPGATTEINCDDPNPTRDFEIELKSLELGCQQNSSKCCFQLAQIYSEKADAAKTHTYLSQACGLKHENACNQLATLNDNPVKKLKIDWFNLDLNANYNSQSNGASNQSSGAGLFSDFYLRMLPFSFLVGLGGRPSKSIDNKIFYIAEIQCSFFFQFFTEWRAGIGLGYERSYLTPKETTLSYGGRIHYKIDWLKLFKMDELYLRYNHASYDLALNSYFLGLTFKF